MKKLFTTSLFMIALAYASLAANVPIAVSGTSFSPSSTTAQVGDVIQFTIVGSHNATRVDQSTWNANGTTPTTTNPFALSTSGSYTVQSSDVGTIYYVCTFHVASFQMKGQITVTDPTPVLKPLTAADLSAYPNPTSGSVTIDNSEAASVKVYDQSGTVVKEIYVEKNGQVDLSGLANGVYFISAISSNGKESRGRVVKK